MKRKSHYTILGIAKGETPKGVRAAYLRLVKTLHPDRAGGEDTQAFREVQKAYDVLSDPAKRRSYDEELNRKRPAQTWQTEPLTRHRHIESLVPDDPFATPVGYGQGPTLNDWFQGFFAGATPIAADPQPARYIDLELWVSPRQATHGGNFGIAVPIETSCGFCSGTGIDWPFPCLACHQRGTIVREQELRLRIPAGVRHGSFIHLQPAHAEGVTIRVRLLVGRRMRGPPFW